MDALNSIAPARPATISLYSSARMPIPASLGSCVHSGICQTESIPEEDRVTTTLKALLGFCGICFIVIPAQARTQDAYIRESGPELLTYEEILSLSPNHTPAGSAEAKLKKLLSTPFINNRAFYAGTKPHRPEAENLGPIVRVVFWNIERGLHLEEIKLAASDKEAFLQRVQSQKTKLSSDVGEAPSKREIDFEQLDREISSLQKADILVLNEVDWGMKRTDYRIVIRELAEALRMNWAYGLEFLEVDPMVIGSEKFEEAADAKEREDLLNAIKVDPQKLKSMHGTAVLSRYPIRSAVLRQFQHQPYDWFAAELSIPVVEKGKRFASRFLGEKMGREVRRGGRSQMIVSLDVPDAPGGEVTIVATHLENRADPKSRRLQMLEVLEEIRDASGPIVIAGDMNTTLSHGLPRSIVKSAVDKLGRPEEWAKKAIKYGTGFGLAFDVFAMGFRSVQFQNDPTAPGIPFIAPNREQEMFKKMEEFRFNDGTAIDFRGTESATFDGKSGTLADSNSRGGKGFHPTFQFERNIGPKGRFKLDWIFVKSSLKEPRDLNGPFRMAPHFPRTMSELNYSLPQRISDHNPISVDLPLNEPKPAAVPAAPEIMRITAPEERGKR